MTETPEEIQRDIEVTRRSLTDTLHALERRLSPRDLMEQAMETVRGSMDGQSRMAETVRENSLPLALMGLGLGWLMVSGMMRWRSDESRGSAYEGAQRGLGYGAQGGPRAGYAGYGATSGYGEGYSGEQEYIPGAGYESTTSYYEGHPESRAGGGMTERARQTAQSMTGRMSGTARQAQERAGEMTHRARRRMGEMTRSMGEVTRSWRERTSDVTERSMQTFQDHPLMVGSMAMLVGAAIGASLPRSRSEDRLMGESRDEFMESARETSQREWEKAKRVAARAADVAREEGRDTIRRVREEGGEAFERVKDAAVDEAERQNLAGIESSRTQH